MTLPVKKADKGALCVGEGMLFLSWLYEERTKAYRDFMHTIQKMIIAVAKEAQTQRGDKEAGEQKEHRVETEVSFADHQKAAKLRIGALPPASEMGNKYMRNQLIQVHNFVVANTGIWWNQIRRAFPGWNCMPSSKYNTTPSTHTTWKKAQGPMQPQR